jgi:hypothetical protein
VTEIGFSYATGARTVLRFTRLSIESLGGNFPLGIAVAVSLVTLSALNA